MTGDGHVPAGMSTWHATAAPIAQPWPAAELMLMNLRAEIAEAAADAQGPGLLAPAAPPRPVWLHHAHGTHKLCSQPDFFGMCHAPAGRGPCCAAAPGVAPPRPWHTKLCCSWPHCLAGV